MKKKLRRITTIVCSLLLFFLACRIIWTGFATDRGLLFPMIVALCIIWLSFGLFRQHRWALWVTMAFLLFLALLLPIGIFNPFTAGDYLAAGKEPPAIGETLLWLIPLEILFLATVYILDPREGK